MICYTNHALDQFLSSIIKKVSLKPGEIVRVGGRSTHSQIEPFLIQKLRQQRRDARAKNELLSLRYDILGNIKKQMEDCYLKYFQCTQQILDTEELLSVMDRGQFLTLIDPILSKLDIFQRHWNGNRGGIYCCQSSEPIDSDDDSSDESQSEEEIVEPLSDYEMNQRMKNRINCHKLNNLTNDDQKLIKELFIKWLEATELGMIVNQMKFFNEGTI